MWIFLCFLIALHQSSSSSGYGLPDAQPAAVFEQSNDLPTPESYLSSSGPNQKNLEQYMRTQRQVQDIREPSLMESHIAAYQRFHEHYQNTEEESTNSKGIRKRRDTSGDAQNRTAHSVREFIKFELSDAKVPDRETEMHIQKQRALKEGGVGGHSAPSARSAPENSDRMAGSESQQIQVLANVRYGSPRTGRSPARYDQVYNPNSATKSPFKIIVPDLKPMHYKVYGSPSYNYPRYLSKQQPQQSSALEKNYNYGEKAKGYRSGHKLSLNDYPNKQWWLPVKKQRQRPQQQSLEHYTEQHPSQNQFITLLQSNQLPTSYMVQDFGGAAAANNPNPKPKFAAVIYKEVPVYYYTQTPKPITEDQGRYYVNPYGQPVRVEDVQIQTSEPDKHLGTQNEYVQIKERKVPFKQPYAPESTTQANLNALSALVGKRPLQQLQGLSQLLDQERPQDSTSPVQFEFEVTTPMPPTVTAYQSSGTQQQPPPDVNVQYYQPKYENYDQKSTLTLSQPQLDAVYNELVQRHRNQEQRNARPLPRPTLTTTVRPQYYQYTTPSPIQVSHTAVTVQTPSEVASFQQPKAPAKATHLRRPAALKQYATAASSSNGGGSSSTGTKFYDQEDDKVSTSKRTTISHKKRFRKRPSFNKARKTELHGTDLTPTTTTKTTTTSSTKHNIHKRDLLRTRPKRRLTRQGLLLRPRPPTVPPTEAPTTTSKPNPPLVNPYERDVFTISVDDFANSFDPKGLKEAFDLIGNQDIPANPYAQKRGYDEPSDFIELEDLEADSETPSYLRQTVLYLREKNNDFLKTINAEILYNDRNEEKAYQQQTRKNGEASSSTSEKGSLPGTMRKFDSHLNDNGSEEVMAATTEIDPSVVESKLITTLKNYIRHDPVKQQILREISEQLKRERQLAQEAEPEKILSEEQSQETQKIAAPRHRPHPPQGRRRTKRGTSFLPFHNESTPYLEKTNVYTKTLTDPEAQHYNGTHITDHTFDYNDDFVEEENATLTVDYEDFSDIRVRNLTRGVARDRSDYVWGDDEDDDYDGGHSVNEHFASDQKYYHERPVYLSEQQHDNAHSETRYPSSYKTSFGPFDHKSGLKYKLVPVTVFKKVPVVDPDHDESLHIDNVNIFEGASHGHYPDHGHGHHHRPPPHKKYRKKMRWHSRHRKYPSKRHRRRPSHAKLRKKFPKIRWLLGHAN